MPDSTLKGQILDDLKTAMKQGDRVKTSVLRILNSEIKNKEIDRGAPLSNEMVTEIIISQAKKRKDSIEAYRQGGRQDLTRQEQAELEILNCYLPEQISEEQIHNIVSGTIQELGVKSPSEIGKVMGVLVPKLKGKADNLVVSRIAKEELNKISNS